MPAHQEELVAMVASALVSSLALLGLMMLTAFLRWLSDRYPWMVPVLNQFSPSPNRERPPPPPEAVTSDVV